MSSDSERQTDHLFQQRYSAECVRVNRFMIWLMIGQWFLGMAFAIFLTPYTWIGERHSVHLHVWMAAVTGGAISAFAILSIRRAPKAAITRHIVAGMQIFWSGLLIHLSGGRIEAHFHVFASLAILSVYRDWKILITATVFVALDHLVRGIWYPLSAFGVSIESPFRWVEHSLWVIFEISFLIPGTRRLRKEIRELCQGQVELGIAKATVDDQVQARTADLQAANVELAAKTEEVRLLSIVTEYTTNAVVIADADIKTEWVNDGFTKMTGYSQDEVYGLNRLGFLLGPKSDPAAVKKLRSAFEDNRHSQLTIEKYRKDGSTFWTQLEVIPVFGDDGEVRHFVSIESDITKLVDVNQQLAEKTLEAEKLALVAQYTDNAVVISDAKGRVEWVNPGFVRITGLYLGEVVGRSRFGLQHGPATDMEKIHTMTSAMASGRGFDQEVILHRQDGEPYHTAIEVRPFHNEHGEVTQFISIESDISVRKKSEADREKMQKQLVDASREMGMAEVATGVLHNVGNVLNSVNVSTDVVLRQLRSDREAKLVQAAELVASKGDDLPHFLTEDSRGKHFCKYLESTARTILKRKEATLAEMTGLVKNIEHIKDIVSMQQAHARKGGTSQDFSVHEILDDALRIGEASLTRHGVAVHREYQKQADCVLTTDKHKVMQILLNLISNAKQAVNDVEVGEKYISVDIARCDSLLEISVKDTGVGIQASVLDSLFQHGFTTKKTGHGFGLHSSANAAKAMGGKIAAYSEGLGHGAMFVLSLPIELTVENTDETTNLLVNT
ncbi:MAG: PAS domain-containing protein [Planctomycetaceae bacterium]